MTRAGNSLISFPSKSLVFCPKIMTDLLIHSFLVREMSNLLTSLISSDQIAHGRPFLVSKMSDSLRLII